MDTRATILSSPFGPTPTISQSMATVLVSLKRRKDSLVTHLLQGPHSEVRKVHTFSWRELSSMTVSRPRGMSAYMLHLQIRVIRRILMLLLSCFPLECHSPIRRFFFNQHPLHRLFGSACFKSQFSSSNFCCFRSYCCFNIFWINIIKPDVSPGKYKFNYIK